MIINYMHLRAVLVVSAFIQNTNILMTLNLFLLKFDIYFNVFIGMRITRRVEIISRDVPQ